MSLASPLARVRGLGSAGQGTHHWWQQRLTALALLPLCLWFIASMLIRDPLNHARLVDWIRTPLTAVLLLLLVVVLLHHAQLGIQVVVEDYIEPEWQKIACIIVVKLLALLAGLASGLAILKIFLGM